MHSLHIFAVLAHCPTYPTDGQCPSILPVLEPLPIIPVCNNWQDISQCLGPKLATLDVVQFANKYAHKDHK